MPEDDTRQVVVVAQDTFSVHGALEYLQHLSLEDRAEVRGRMDTYVPPAHPQVREAATQTVSEDTFLLWKPDGGVYLRTADGTVIETPGVVRQLDARPLMLADPMEEGDDVPADSVDPAAGVEEPPAEEQEMEGAELTDTVQPREEPPQATPPRQARRRAEEFGDENCTTS